jgi:uncharacterized protein (TIGR02118 family)
MIRISVMCPRRPGARFDHAYYQAEHIPMALRLLGVAVRSITIERGLDPGPPWPAPTYEAVCNFLCDSLEAYERAIRWHGAALQADLVNFSDIEPVIQVGDVAEGELR